MATLEELIGDDWTVESLTKSGSKWYAEVSRLRYEWGDWMTDGGAGDASTIYGAIQEAIQDALKRCNYADHSYNMK